MPEIHDPLEALSRFDASALADPGLPADEVRRRGDRLRRRRAATAVLGAAAAVTLIAAGGFALTGSGGDRTPPPADGPTPGVTRAPTQGPSDDSTRGSGDPLVTIPGDFPLDAASVDLTGDGGEVRGPAPDHPGLGDELVCGAEVWKVPATDRLGFSSTGPEYADVREVRTYAAADAALAQMAELRSSVAGCDREVRDGSTLVWTTYPEDTGYNTFTVGYTFEGHLGGAVYQVTRVGRAVLVLMREGEWSLDSAPAGAGELTAVTRRVAPAMCAFTVAGC